MLVCLKRLQHLDLSFNQIDTSNDSFIRTLKFNSELVSLILKGNIEYKFDEIKYKCLEILPKVEYLDTEQIINNKKKDSWSKNRKTYIIAKGIKGNKKKCKNIMDYVKFKQKDLADNKQAYEEEWLKNKKLIEGLEENKIDNNNNNDDNNEINEE